MLFSYIYWNPRKEIFTIPFFNIPILWYSLFFALGFAIGYFIFAFLLRRFFYFYPSFIESEILSGEKLFDYLKKSQESLFLPLKSKLSLEKKFSLKYKKQLLVFLNELVKKNGRKFVEEKLDGYVLSLKKRSFYITDHILTPMILATIIGARLGHFLFYEKPSTYLKDPLSILKVWEGGLASHGAAIAIIVVIYFLGNWIKKIYKNLNWIKLLDFICVPTALAGFFIRIGNFFNQEILGKPTFFFTAVVFGNPLDHSAPTPRHPVQIYEALFYLCTFFLLFYFSLKKNFLLEKGRILGLFLIFVFFFRFIAEFFKEHQSYFLATNTFWNMGHLLSIPMIFLGFIFLFYKKTKKI